MLRGRISWCNSQIWARNVTWRWGRLTRRATYETCDATPDHTWRNLLPRGWLTSHCLQGDSRSTRDVYFNHFSCIIFTDRPQFSIDHLPCVVEDDVDAAKCLLDFGKGWRDLGMLSDIQIDGHETCGRVLAKVRWHLRLAESGDDAIPLSRELLIQDATETSLRTSE